MERIKKGHKEEIMKRIEEAANPNNYETSWSDKGIPISKKKSEIKKGRKSRAKGAKFELEVRKDLEKSGWAVAKWTNNVELEGEYNA